MNFFDTNKINYKNIYKFNFYSTFFFIITFIISSTILYESFLFPKFIFLEDPKNYSYISFFVGLPLILISSLFYLIIYPDYILFKIKRDHPLIRKLDPSGYNKSKTIKLIMRQYGYIINFPLENEQNLDKFTGDLNLLQEEEKLFELLENQEKQDNNPEVKLTAQQSEQLLRINSLTSGRESIDLAVAVIAMFFGLFYIDILTKNNLPFVALFIIIAISYPGHELAHKFSGNKFGINSRFILTNALILITMFTGLFRLRFPYAGSVKTKDNIRDKQIQGKIAFSATLYNIALIAIGFVFLILGRYFTVSYFNSFFIALMNFNIIIAILTLIPIMDGRKILDWKFAVWIVLTLFVILVVLFQYFYLHRMFYNFSNL